MSTTRRLAESYFNKLELRRSNLAEAETFNAEYDDICKRQENIAKTLEELTAAYGTVARVIYYEARNPVKERKQKAK